METTNLIRPKEFENESRDCTVRAFSLASNIPYAEVHAGFKKLGRTEKHGIHIGKKTKVNGKVYKIRKKNRIDTKDLEKEFGVKMTQVARSGTPRRLIKKHSTGRFYCLKRGHAFAIIDGLICDGTSYDCQIKYAWKIEKVFEL